MCLTGGAGGEVGPGSGGGLRLRALSHQAGAGVHQTQVAAARQVAPERRVEAAAGVGPRGAGRHRMLLASAPTQLRSDGGSQRAGPSARCTRSVGRVRRTARGRQAEATAGSSRNDKANNTTGHKEAVV